MYELTKISYSAISTFKSCETDYFCKYILNLPQRQKSSTMIGTGVHKVLECLCAIEKQKKEGVKRPLVVDQYAGKVYKNTPLETIIDRVYDKMVELTPKVTWKKKDRTKYLKLVDIGLNSKNSPYQYDILDVEKYFLLKLDGYPWAKIGDDSYLSISGVIDVLYTDNNKQCCVLDYKTGKPKYDWNTGKTMTYTDFTQNIQLCMYYFALRKLMPDVQPILKLWYLQSDEVVTLFFDDSVFSYVERFLEESYQKIKNLKKPRQNRSWKCSKFCCWGKQKFSDIDKSNLSISNQVDNFITKQGEEMTVCEAIHAFMKFRTIEEIVTNCKEKRNERH